MELLLLLAVMPLLLIAPIAEAWERRCERRRAAALARDLARGWQRTWMRLYGPLPRRLRSDAVSVRRGAGASSPPARRAAPCRG